MKRKLWILTLMFVILTTSYAFGQQEFEYFDVNASMKEALKSINADIFRAENDVDGADIKVAIIDTGIDVSHPDLQKTPQGRTKIIDFVDFTDEGLVNTKIVTKVLDNHVFLEGKKYNVEGITSNSGLFHVGVFKESQLSKDSPLAQDINRNGKNTDIFGVLVTDSILPGIYDTVYVDTNSNFSFADEKPLKVYNKGFQWDSFGTNNPASSFIVSDIDIMGNWIQLSFDGNGHGTHVAGIVGANGKLKGTAPGVQIIAIKALSSDGMGSWEEVSKALDYAKKQGAHIINISIGNLATSYEEYRDQLEVFKKISLERESLVVIASGNEGPGLGTAYNVGESESVITVGAYMSEALWTINYNTVVPGETLWFYSGVGPQLNGTLAPSVVAPSAVISTVNRWDSGGYFAMDGTSMAAPFVSGSAALILQRARISDLDIDVWNLKKCIETGARKIEGFDDFEQGYGLIDVKNTWEQLKKRAFSLDKIGIKTPFIDGYTQGAFSRDHLRSEQELSLINLSDTLQEIILESKSPWISIEKEELLLPRGKPQELILSYKIPEIPGVYSGKILGNAKNERTNSFEFITTVVVPYDLEKTSALDFNNSLQPSRWHRYYFKTVPGMSDLKIKLDVLKRDIGHRGRGLLYVYDPDGIKVFEGYAGEDYISPLSCTVFDSSKPKAGIWEVVVVSDYNLSHFGISKTEYKLSIAVSGMFTD